MRGRIGITSDWLEWEETEKACNGAEAIFFASLIYIYKSRKGMWGL